MKEDLLKIKKTLDVKKELEEFLLKIVGLNKGIEINNSLICYDGVPIAVRWKDIKIIKNPNNRAFVAWAKNGEFYENSDNSPRIYTLAELDALNWQVYVISVYSKDNILDYVELKD